MSLILGITAELALLILIFILAVAAVIEARLTQAAVMTILIIVLFVAS